MKADCWDNQEVYAPYLPAVLVSLSLSVVYTRSVIRKASLQESTTMLDESAYVSDEDLDFSINVSNKSRSNQI